MEIQALTTSRGKSANGEWVYGYYAVHHIADTDNHDVLQGYKEVHAIFNDTDKSKSYWTDVDPASVGLSTGKCDDSKAQRVIFTGDIVSCRSCRCDDTLMQKELGIIEYDTQSASFVIHTRNKVVQLGSTMLDCTIVVIGNKTDSPKLFNRINGNNTPEPQI